MVFNITSTIISILAFFVSVYAICISRKSYLTKLKAVLYCNDYKIDAAMRNITFYIENFGGFIHLNKIVAKTSNVKIINNYPINIPSGVLYELQVEYKDDMTKICNSKIEIDVMYLDKDKNHHTSTLQMKNGKVTFKN